MSHKNIIAVLLLSAVLLVWFCIPLLFAGFVRENNAIEVNDKNRSDITSLIKNNFENYEEFPNMTNVVKLEYFFSLHDEEITFFYEDGSEKCFYVHEAHDNPLFEYIKTNGYSVYFKSSDFAFDLIKIVLLFISVVVCVVMLVKNRLKHRVSL